MKPDFSILPEPDRSTEDRAVSQAMKDRVREEQGGICARSWCEAQALDVDHIIPLWNYGTNERSNLVALCTTCHAQKTKAEAAMRAKAKAQAGETGQHARRQKRGHGSIKSASFQSRNRKLNGTVGLTQAAARAAHRPQESQP